MRLDDRRVLFEAPQSEKEPVKTLETVNADFTELLKKLETVEGTQFQSLFVDLVVFIVTDLNKILLQEKDDYRPAIGKILQDAIGKVSKKFTAGDLPSVEIKDKILPLLSEAQLLFSSPKVTTDQVRTHLEKWAALGINVA